MFEIFHETFDIPRCTPPYESNIIWHIVDNCRIKEASPVSHHPRIVIEDANQKFFLR